MEEVETTVKFAPGDHEGWSEAMAWWVEVDTEEIDGRISQVKANTEALLSDLDTIGNPDRADAFFSLGYKDSDLPPGFYDDNDSNDWVDAQLYY